MGPSPRQPTDDRAQAVVIGAVLLLGIAVISLASYQSFLVPLENEQVELDAYQNAERSLAEYRDRVLEGATKGYSAQQTVALGTTYPLRVAAINPPPSVGHVETVAVGNVTVSNATAIGDAGVYWDGSPNEFETVHVTYTPNYHRIDAQPITLSGGLMYRHSGAGASPLSAQTVVNGNDLTLTTLTGDIDETDVETELVVEPVSTSTQQVAVSADGDPDGDGDPELFVTLPTTLSAATWSDILDGEPNVVAVSDVPGGVELELDGTVTYDLSVNRVEVREATVGGDVPATDGHYLVKQPTGTAVAPNETTELAVEVRDRLDNPVSGVTVTFEGDNLTATTVTTDADGLASVTYTPETRGVKTVDATFDGGDVDRERVSFTIRSHVAGNEGGAKGTGFEGQDQFLDMGSTSGVRVTGQVNSGEFDFDFENTATENRTLVRIRYIAYLKTGANIVDEIQLEGVRYQMGDALRPTPSDYTVTPGSTLRLASREMYRPDGGGVDPKNSDVVFFSAVYETPTGEQLISTYVVNG